MLMSSFKSNDSLLQDVSSVRAFLPVGDLSLDNYLAVFKRVPFGRFLFNSLFVSTATVVLGLLINSLIGFAIAKMEWRGKNLILGIIIALLILPFDVLAIPMLYLCAKLPWISFAGGFHITQGWFNSYQVQILPFVASAFSIFLFVQYFKGLPKELIEAALVDGASWFRIYRSIAIPLSGPVFGTVAILTFLPMWNMYLWPAITVQDEEYRSIMLGLQYFYVNFGTSWGQIMAYLSLLTVPIVVLFLCMQRFFVTSVASTGIKG
jgi:multiple sugar transport system permease protein